MQTHIPNKKKKELKIFNKNRAIGKPANKYNLQEKKVLVVALLAEPVRN